MSKLKPAHIIIAIALLLVAAFLLPEIFADQPGARSQDGDIITETVAVVDTNSQATFTVRLLEGSDAVHESDHMFEALAGLPGVGKASLDAARLEFTVHYDDSAITPDAIRARLLDTGYVVPTRDDATPTELAEHGSVQRISIADTGERFDPFLVLAKADVPIEIEFAPGQACRTTVKFPQLGIEQDISEGGTVELPALEPGVYEIACSGDASEGTIVVE